MDTNKTRVTDAHFTKILNHIWSFAGKILQDSKAIQTAAEWVDQLSKNPNAFITNDGIFWIKDLQVGIETTAYPEWLPFAYDQESPQDLDARTQRIKNTAIEYCFTEKKLGVHNVQFDELQTQFIRRNITQTMYDQHVAQQKYLQEVDKVLQSGSVSQSQPEGQKHDESKPVKNVSKSNARNRHKHVSATDSSENNAAEPVATS